MYRCKKCTKAFKPTNVKNKNYYCSIKCSSDDRKGKAQKEYRLSWGYRYKFVPTHPDSNKQGYIAEHRLNAEIKIGRRLSSKEVVHHINGIRDDNRLDNLMVCTRQEHNIEHDSIKVLHSEKVRNKIRQTQTKNKTGIQKECSVCQKSIYVFKNRLRKHNFCTTKCFGKFMHENNINTNGIKK